MHYQYTASALEGRWLLVVAAKDLGAGISVAMTTIVRRCNGCHGNGVTYTKVELQSVACEGEE